MVKPRADTNKNHKYVVKTLKINIILEILLAKES